MMYLHDFNTIARAFAKAKITGEPAILVVAEELQNKYPKFNPEKFMDNYERQLHQIRYKQEKNTGNGQGQQEPEKNRMLAPGLWVRSRNRKKINIQR